MTEMKRLKRGAIADIRRLNETTNILEFLALWAKLSRRFLYEWFDTEHKAWSDTPPSPQSMTGARFPVTFTTDAHLADGDYGEITECSEAIQRWFKGLASTRETQSFTVADKRFLVQTAEEDGRTLLCLSIVVDLGALDENV